MKARFGLFEFDDRTGELRREGEVVKLAPQPARVLALLLARPGEVVLRDELRAHIWGDETFVDFERGLNFCILQVRTALGDTSDNPRFVQTVPRKGYRFIAPVVGATSDPASNLRPPPGTSPLSLPGGSGASLGQASPKRPSAAETPSLKHVAIVIGMLVIAAPLTWLVYRQSGAATAAPTTRVRIAVLPFVNLTGDRDADYLVEGIADELIAQLGRVSPQKLGVIARTSVMRYRNSDKNISEIGRELDVRFVLEGSVRRDGTRLRVTTDLVDVSDQSQVWSDVFERPIGDSMDLQTDLATRVARALALELVPGGTNPALPRSTKNADAWDAYLRGRYFLARGGGDAGRQALEQFEMAVTLDPQFAAAWAQISEACHMLVMAGAAAPNDVYPRAVEAARRALDLDESHAEAHIASGIVQLWYEWQPAAAARAFERALALNPSQAAAHHDYAWALVGLGRFDEAVQHITTARDLDPLSVRANTDIGWLYLHLRQPTEATRACQHTLAIQPEAGEAQACLERAFLQRGLHADALRAARATLPKNVDLVLPAARQPADEVKAIWRWRLERMEATARTRWVSPYQLAVHYVFVGDLDRGMEQLERAYAARVGVLAFIRTDPAIDPLRSHARFDALLQKVGESAR